MDIAAWLRSLGMECYVEAFRANHIDAELLSELTPEDLTSLGVTSVGHRRKLLRAIAALQCEPDRSAAATPESSEHTQPTAPAYPEGDRRQVTVLFADLSGFTSLSRELDPEELHGLMGRFFSVVDAVVAEFGGTVDKHIGDCVMAIFGAPIAHDNDPERAVRAALEMRRRLAALTDPRGRPLALHAGIASGQVVASGTGSAAYSEYTVTGQSVNLASRLTGSAAAGEILVSDAVHRSLVGLIDCADLGTLTVKGFAERVRVWRLDALAAAPGRAKQRPFVGRYGELQQFRALLTACRETGQGRAVHLRGEAGIGKTRLVEAFMEEAKVLGFGGHAALVLDFGTGTGRDAIQTLVRSLLGVDGGDAADAVERAVAEGTLDEPRRIHLYCLLDLTPPTELRGFYEAMDSNLRIAEARASVAALAARVSARAPQVLIVEDIHWADAVTLNHLATLAEGAAGNPYILVMTSRVEGDPLDSTWRAESGGAPLLTLDLGPLLAAEAEALAAGYSRTRDDFVRRCIASAAGNPLFLDQLLQHAEESAGSSVPASVQSLVQARMDRLPPEDKQALQTASVLGQQFEIAGLRRLLDQADYDPSRLVRHQLVRPHGDGLLFSHALIRDGIYHSLLKERRRDLHVRAAEWFGGHDPLRRAEHLERAENSAAPVAYLEAARAQAAAYRSHQALALAERGLSLARTVDDRFALISLCGEVLLDLGRPVAAIDAFRQALKNAPDESAECRAWIGLTDGMRITDQLDEAYQALDKAQALAERHQLVGNLAQIHHLRGNLHFPRGHVDACLIEHRLALQCAVETGSPELEARAYSGLGDGEYARGRMMTAGENFRRCIELSRAHDLGRIEVANLPMLAFSRFFSNGLEAALADSLTAINMAGRLGHKRAEIIARHSAYFCCLSTADFAAAKAHSEAAIDLSRELGARRFEAETLAFLAEVERACGHRAEALKLLHDALAIARETGMSYCGPVMLGTLALATDDPQERQAALAEGEALLAEGGPGHNHLLLYSDAIDASLQRGEWDTAERYAAALEDYTRSEPLPRCDFVIRRARALAASGRSGPSETVLATLRELRDEAAGIGWRSALPPIDEALCSAWLSHSGF